MRKTFSSRKVSLRQPDGFTLIEMLIVIIILGVLALIVVPQITVSTDDARVSTLKSNLATFRSAIELYYIQHSSVYPGMVDEADGTTAITADADALDAFKAQLTLYTDANGKTSTTKDTTFKYGPYLKEGIPKNPYTETNSVKVVYNQKDLTTARTATTSNAWQYWIPDGIVFPDDSTDHDDY
jgi:prepilin-type N-terminal cleavage/methylation domain-containing protein